MKFFASTGLFLLAVVVVATLAKTDDQEWEDFKEKHGKSHKDAKEEAKRKALFIKAHHQIKKHNSAAGKSFKMGHNKFSDWTADEKKQLAGKKSAQVRQVEPIVDLLSEITTRQLPASIDYRNDACMGPVKDQGSCGSCWTFSSIAPIEFLLCKNRKTYIPLSEQQLLNCACSGCGGGDYYPAWSYLNKTSSGSVSSSVLGYTSAKNTCASFTSGLIKPTAWARLPTTETAIMTGLKTYGPLSMAINVADSFYSYESGVYDPEDCFNTLWDLNHAMATVGYGTDSATGLKYWVIRNSWGTDWGVKGYMLIRRGVNTCGAETDVAYVKTNLPVVL